jgi:hypothetical protein
MIVVVTYIDPTTKPGNLGCPRDFSFFRFCGVTAAEMAIIHKRIYPNLAINKIKR